MYMYLYYGDSSVQFVHQVIYIILFAYTTGPELVITVRSPLLIYCPFFFIFLGLYLCLERLLL